MDKIIIGGAGEKNYKMVEIYLTYIYSWKYYSEMLVEGGGWQPIISPQASPPSQCAPAIALPPPLSCKELGTS